MVANGLAESLFKTFLAQSVLIDHSETDFVSSHPEVGVLSRPGNHTKLDKKTLFRLGVKRPFAEQLSEFQCILGATLGVALTTQVI